MTAAPGRIAVCGGGIIGSATAHFLAERGQPPVIIERCADLCSASAKAGGFLALDWCDASAEGPLARKSFELHRTLAETLGKDVGYRALTTLSATVQEPHGGRSAAKGNGKRGKGVPGWVRADALQRVGTLGTEATTAQVHPAKLTAALREACVKRGGQVQTGVVEGLEFGEPAADGSVAVTGVHVAGQGVMPMDAVVIAMGPWSHLAGEWLSTLPRNPLPRLASICGMKANSIVLQTAESDAITPHALFLQYSPGVGEPAEPEVYPRPAGEVYLCGYAEDPGPPPADPADVVPSQGAPESLRRVAAAVSPELAGAACKAEQACLLPISPDGVPLIGQVPGVRGLYIATGHSCWGILNGPATGAALAELVVTGKCTLLDLSPFDPARLAGRRAGAVRR